MADIDYEFACRDDCLDKIVPSDLRALVMERDALRARVADLEAREEDRWKSSATDYDRSIHSNPDARAWAEFFKSTFPDSGADEETMLAWFANAMMAAVDVKLAELEKQEPILVRIRHRSQADATRVDSWKYIEYEFVDGLDLCFARDVEVQKLYAEPLPLAMSITADEHRILQENVDGYVGLGFVMSRASLDIIQKLLDRNKNEEGVG